jgi:hypothetical protein
MVSVGACCSICILATFLAGCAASSKEAISGPPRAQSAAPTSMATSAPTAAPGNTAAANTSTSAELSASSVEPAPNPVVDLAKRPVDEAENTGQVCRQMLKPNTNSIINVCGTPAQWKQFKAAEARQAQELLLNMQAGRH